jgi:hypothetical protein
MVEWFDAVREKVDMWRRRWNPRDHALPPMLYLEPQVDGIVVHDSRSGDQLAHRISDSAHELLKALARPRRRADLALAADAARELTALERLGLVFAEGEHVMSLVFPQKPSWSEALDGWSWAA